MHTLRRIFTSHPKQWADGIFSKRRTSTSMVPMTEIIRKRNDIFLQEQGRQLEEVGRVEQIPIEVTGPPEDVVLIMNKNISTPYDCCRHISSPLCDRTPLALIDDKILWDMHRPLPGPCRIKFLSFRDKDPYSVNEAFWRTGSFILGAVISNAFKDDVGMVLRSFPECRVITGSFIYDVMMGLENWVPTDDELKVLSAEFLTFVFNHHKIERLSVKKSLALKMFEDNPYKTNEISKYAADSEDNLVTLYKVGDYIDLCSGPLVGDTSFFGRATVTAVHHTVLEHGELYRFQAVALPKGILLNQQAYSVLTERGGLLNEIPVPDLPSLFQYYGETSVKNSNNPINPDRGVFKF